MDCAYDGILLTTLDSTYAVVALWAAHQTERGLENLDPWQPQSALVLRQGLEVKVFAVNPDAVAFINSLAQGATLENAVEHALEAGAEFDLHQCLALLISHNAITHLHPEQKVSP